MRRNPAFPGLQRVAGFTLIELMVVVVIVAILAATVMFSFSGADRERILAAETKRLALLLEMTRQQAVQRNQEWGVFFDDHEYRFSSYDVENGEWVPFERRPLRAGVVEHARMRISVEDQYEMPGVSKKEDLPDLVFFSSGESQAFELTLEPLWETRKWFIESDGLSRITAEREEG